MMAGFHPMSNLSNPEFMVVDRDVINLVARMPDNCVAMSYHEFFAEIYALYYDYDDPKRKVGLGTHAKVIDEYIGNRDPQNQRRPTAKRKSARIVRNW